MKLQVVLGFGLSMSVAPALAAQDTATLIQGDRAASAELAKIIGATQQSGLPVEPILVKIRYALLVAHAPAPRIVAAARATAARLEEARNALAPHPTDTDIAAGEDALSSNVSPQALRDIRKVSANRPVAVPLGVLAQLVANGVEEKRAAKIVSDLMRRGATTEQIAALGNEVFGDVALGTAVDNALELRMNRLNAVLGLPAANADALDLQSRAGDPKGPRKP